MPLDDVAETSNYIAAMSHGLQRIESGVLPLSNRLLREVHALLMSAVRGAYRAPGEFRRSQNWLGGTRRGNARFVPPPPPEVVPAMSDLEKFLHDDPEPTPILVKAALAHVQFETIHPFLDGNGRVGRLLITLVLCSEKVLQQPLLYLSLLRRATSSWTRRAEAAPRPSPWIVTRSRSTSCLMRRAVSVALVTLDVVSGDRGELGVEVARLRIGGCPVIGAHRSRPDLHRYSQDPVNFCTSCPV